MRQTGTCVFIDNVDINIQTDYCNQCGDQLASMVIDQRCKCKNHLLMLRTGEYCRMLAIRHEKTMDEFSEKFEQKKKNDMIEITEKVIKSRTGSIVFWRI